MKNRRIMQAAKPLLPRAAGFDVERLLAPAQALAAYAARVTLALPRAETVALADAADRILARAIVADCDYPRTARSAMDGFALRSGETPGRLRIVGEVRMGHIWEPPLAPGEAVAIPTGGALPVGTDAVVPIEDARSDGRTVDVSAAVPAGDCTTPRGADMLAGELVLPAGRYIGAPELGVLATLGVVDVPVYARPRLAVISSGDELVDPARDPGAAQIRDSNRYAIAESLRRLGAQPVHFPTVPDEPGALEAALRLALERCDGAVVSGGSSVGARDVTPAAVSAQGEPGVVVHGLRIKPGKPTVLGAVGGKPVIGLPGNPVSALMVLEAIAAPIITALSGASPQAVELEAEMAESVRGRPGWTWYVPVALENDGGRLVAHPLPLRSSLVSLPARAGGYVVVGERASLTVGERVRVRRFLSGGSSVA
jgi:molybdopterin molybdotransferase